jgi:hypothetical protein
MGNRRIGRKRLYGVEKKGQKIDLESGAGISGAIKSATQHRQGQEIITEILVDLGTSQAVIAGGSAEESAVGVGTSAAHLTRLTAAKFGIITEIRAVCLEAPLPAAVDTVDIWTNGSAIVADSDVGTAGTPVAGPADLSAVGEDTSAAYVANNVADKYLYIANATGKTGGDTFTAGKLAIYIHGFVAPSDL